MSIKSKIRNYLPDWLIDIYHLKMAILANIVYGFPARKLKVIGVTGTDGKTTTCHLITRVLETAGFKVGRITTIDWKIGDQLSENNLKMTTVRQAKEKLFANRPYLTVINADDPVADSFLGYSANRTLTFGLNSAADLVAKKVYAKSGGTDFVLLYNGRQASINLPLPGTFNVYNALAAAAVGIGLGLTSERVIEGLQAAEPVPGRMEVIDQGQPFVAIVDYAHTPDALKKVYETLKPTVRGKLISVLGATGRRDRTKRPLLGALAGQYADLVIVTNEDPYDEDPGAIIDEVAAGVPRGRPKKGGRLRINREGEVPFKYKDNGEDIWWWRVPDRKEAIAKACQMARPQDVVLVTGKGAEKVMAVGDKLVPFSDRQVLEELLQKYRV